MSLGFKVYVIIQLRGVTLTKLLGLRLNLIFFNDATRNAFERLQMFPKLQKNTLKPGINPKEKIQSQLIFFGKSFNIPAFPWKLHV